jgi:hypothetical protein
MSPVRYELDVYIPKDDDDDEVKTSDLTNLRMLATARICFTIQWFCQY